MKENVDIEDSFDTKGKTENAPLKEEINEINFKDPPDFELRDIKTFNTMTLNENEVNDSKDKIKTILNSLTKISIYLSIFTGIEFLGSFLSDSVGVLTIAAELFSDLVKSLITIISILIIKNPANEVMTYGYHRSEIIASLCSTLIVLVLAIWIVIDSMEQINIATKRINGKLMIIFSILGLFFNLIIRYIKKLNPVPDIDEGKFLKNYNNSNNKDLDTPLLEDYLGLEAKDDDKIIIQKITQNQIYKIEKKKLVHLICDVSQSTFTIIASLLIYFFEFRYPWITIFDNICGITFLIIMLIIAWPIAKECIDILMEAAPSEINTKTLYNELKQVDGVINLHDIHLWSLSIGRPCITMHMLSNDPQRSIEEATKICKKYGINHCTIQAENKNEERRISFVKCDLIENNEIN